MEAFINEATAAPADDGDDVIVAEQEHVWSAQAYRGLVRRFLMPHHKYFQKQSQVPASANIADDDVELQ